jgi:hypothetical protein
MADEKVTYFLNPFGENRSPLECGGPFGLHENHLHCPKDASGEESLSSLKEEF